MKFGSWTRRSLLVLTTTASMSSLASSQYAQERTVQLRGNRQAVHHRVVRPHHTEQGLLKQQQHHHQPDPLVEPHHHHKVKLRGTTSAGVTREVLVDSDKLEQVRQHQHTHVHYKHQHSHPDTKEHIRVGTSSELQEEEEKDEKEPGVQTPTIEEARHHQKKSLKSNHQTTTKRLDLLPPPSSQQDTTFNQTLYEQLYYAPFDIYERAVGTQETSETDSFPVLTVPTWMGGLQGVYSAFSKTAKPLVFENKQVLLDWESIQAVSHGAPADLQAFLRESEFQGSLLLAKYFGNSHDDDKDDSTFLGLLLSYFQFGVQKHVLIPFARLGDFFENHHHDSSSSPDDFLRDPSTQHMEMAALHDMILSKLANGTSTDQGILESMEYRSQQLEDLDELRFQQLYQVLIRRSYLFSYGFADCLHQDPYALRECLDETFDETVKLETKLRGAIAEKLQHHTHAINSQFHATVSEACLQAQGGGGVGDASMYFGSGSCHNVQDLQHFVTSSAF